MPTSEQAQITKPDDAKVVWVVGDSVRFMGEVAGSNLGVVEVMVPGGSGTPPHRHSSPEVFLVTEGQVAFGLFDNGGHRTIVAGPGAVVTVPSGLGHNYSNQSAAPARFTAVVETQMLRFFEDVGSPTAPPPGPPSEQVINQLTAACARHGIELVS